MINGKVTGFFSCFRGVRKEDPLTPLLFYITEEKLSKKLFMLVDQGKLTYISVGKTTTSNPTYFSYNLMISCKATKKKCSSH